MTEEFVYPNIYLCGKSGAGKSTVANMLANEFGYRKTALADGVKLGIQVMLKNSRDIQKYINSIFPPDTYITENYRAYDIFIDKWEQWLTNIYERSYRARGGTNCYVTPRVDKSKYREFMQWWGTDICRMLDEAVWIKYYFNHNFFFETPVVCDDVRFYNEEYAMACPYNFIGIHIIRDEYNNATVSEDQAKHESEQYEPHHCKYTIYNNGDVEQLNTRLHEIMEAIINENK